jgi:GntR family transcriptional repressor for pyruvate dehydrogenase complex
MIAILLPAARKQSPPHSGGSLPRGVPRESILPVPGRPQNPLDRGREYRRRIPPGFSGQTTRPPTPTLTAPAKVEFEAIQKTKVYEEVVAQLERLILDGTFSPGDKLPPERELAERFGISRSAVREAIRALELKGFVEPRPGEGTLVRTPSLDRLLNPLASLLGQKRELVHELLDVRKMIEPPLAARAARNAEPGEVARMDEILSRQKEKITRQELAIEEDSEFHYTIARASKNSVILKVLDMMMDILRESREQSLQVDGRRERSLAGHRRIFNAIKRRDPVAAEEAMRQHLTEIETILFKKL